MYIVLILRGKGKGNADFIKAKPFDDLKEAKKYVEDNTDMDSKYWTSCQLVRQNQEIETYYEYLKD